MTRTVRWTCIMTGPFLVGGGIGLNHRVSETGRREAYTVLAEVGRCGDPPVPCWEGAIGIRWLRSSRSRSIPTTGTAPAWSRAGRHRTSEGGLPESPNRGTRQANGKKAADPELLGTSSGDPYRKIKRHSPGPRWVSICPGGNDPMTGRQTFPVRPLYLFPYAKATLHPGNSTHLFQ